MTNALALFASSVRYLSQLQMQSPSRDAGFAGLAMRSHRLLVFSIPITSLSTPLLLASLPFYPGYHPVCTLATGLPRNNVLARLLFVAVQRGSAP